MRTRILEIVLGVLAWTVALAFLAMEIKILVDCFMDAW